MKIKKHNHGLKIKIEMKNVVLAHVFVYVKWGNKKSASKGGLRVKVGWNL
jgi:hypothetical protein